MLVSSILSQGWIAFPILVLYWIIAILALIATDREPPVTIAWILVICLLPGIGLVLYYFTGRNWEEIARKSKWHKARQSIRIPFMEHILDRYVDSANAFLAANTHTQVEHLIKLMWNQSGVPAIPARDIDIWYDGQSYFPNLLDDLRGAQEFIHMQYFIWEDDELADQVSDILVERLKAGVEVRILNDFFGSIAYSKKGLRRVKEAGGVVLSDITAIRQINYRNHRKITVIDGICAHTGGFNIGQEYIDGGHKYDSWRDTGIRFCGPAVFLMQDLFSQRWFEVDHESLWLSKYFPLDRIGDGDVLVQIAAQGVEDVWDVASDSYKIAISRANDYVWIQSPYYVPTTALEATLETAAFSGIDVRLMITGVPDKKIAWDAAFTYFRPLLMAGVKIYLYETGFFHSKMIVTDDIASSVGTMNLDFRSLELHKELTVWMYDKKIALRNKQAFLDDRMHCRKVTLAELDEIGPIKRFENSAYRLLSRLL
ncbi:MAG: cardiolipin synthase [Coriobacteriia bacterium]|nr:cardiolipin synthase [Coriobacteriia bacterium]